MFLFCRQSKMWERECGDEFGGLRTCVSNLSSTVGTKGLSSQGPRWVEFYSQRRLLSGMSENCDFSCHMEASQDR